MASRTTASPRSTGTARRVSAKSAAAGAAQHANQANLQPQGGTQSIVQKAADVQAQGNPNKLPETTAPAPAPTQTNDANLVMPHVQHSVLVSNLKAVNAGFKAAINLEIAIACAVFAEAGATDTKAKKELYSVYKDAGFDCEVGGEGKDYKTVNRRIGYAAQFFDSLEKDAIKTVMGEARDDAAIQTLTAHLSTKYNFRYISDVLEAAGVTPPSRQPRTTGGNDNTGGGTQGGSAGPAPQGGGTANEQGQSVFRTSATATPTGVPTAGDQGVMAAMGEATQQREAAQQPAPARREFDDASKWVRHSFEGATLFVPVDMKTECLHELGIKLVQAAAHMRGAKIDVATLNAEFKEAVAH